MIFKKTIVLALLLALALSSFADNRAEEIWRSDLYQSFWAPGYPDREGRFLHDFSYAGYKTGTTPLPETVPGAYIDVTEAPYSADCTGAQDATNAIQAAIDAVAAAGGGTVYLPPGTYRLSLRKGRECALQIGASNVLLKGAGMDKSFLF